MGGTGFETKSQSNSSFTEWIPRVLLNPLVSKKFTQIGTQNALNFAKNFYINRRHGDIEFLVSRQSIATHTFVAWGEFGQALEDGVAFTCLHMFREAKAIKLVGDFGEVTLDEVDKKKLEVKALSELEF